MVNSKTAVSNLTILVSVCLITYSKANVEIIASRESFAVVMLDSFQNAEGFTGRMGNGRGSS